MAGRNLFSSGMFSRINLTLGAALVAIGPCSFIQSSPANEALADLLALNDNDDVERDSEDGDNTDPPRPRTRHRSVNAEGTPLPDGSEGLSMALNSAAEAAEAESVVVTGSFDIYPVEYPALPPVEGTRINSGKKTSFVKPEEFPVFSNNDYREVTATTPGIIVSEEPNSPIINFGYRGLDSQRSEFMQVLKDGVSIKNEQFGFPETITRQFSMQWSGLNLSERARLCSSGRNPGARSTSS